MTMRQDKNEEKSKTEVTLAELEYLFSKADTLNEFEMILGCCQHVNGGKTLKDVLQKYIIDELATASTSSIAATEYMRGYISALYDQAD